MCVQCVYGSIYHLDKQCNMPWFGVALNFAKESLYKDIKCGNFHTLCPICPKWHALMPQGPSSRQYFQHPPEGPDHTLPKNAL